MLGADFDIKLKFDPPTNMNDNMVAYQSVGLKNMSVKEMAAIINDQELLEAIRLMEESPEDHAWCRCGSRLAWKDCHASPLVTGQHPHYMIFLLLERPTCPTG